MSDKPLTQKRTCNGCLHFNRNPAAYLLGLSCREGRKQKLVGEWRIGGLEIAPREESCHAPRLTAFRLELNIERGPHNRHTTD